MAKKYTKSFPMFARLVNVAKITPVELHTMFAEKGHHTPYGTMWNYHQKARGDQEVGNGIPRTVEATARVLWEEERERQKRQAVLNLRTEASEVTPEAEPPTKLAEELQKWQATAKLTVGERLIAAAKSVPRPEPEPAMEEEPLWDETVDTMPVEPATPGVIHIRAPEGGQFELADLMITIGALTKGKIRAITIEY